MDTFSESDLVARAQAGDGSAWDGLMQAQLPAVFRLAYLLTGDADEAEDVAQEAFVRAYRAMQRFDTSRPLRPWLLGIARNLARNRWRASGRYMGMLQRLVLSDPQSHRPQAQPRELDRAGSEEAHTLWQAIRRLGRSDQEILYLRYFLDLSEAETARATGTALGTVKSRSHRAMKRLREVVEREYPSLRKDLDL
jgi:RNA polymerase sigma-70 factor, ECF subfamily